MKMSEKKSYQAWTISDEFWEAVISDADRLYKKYDNSRFAKDLILAELTEFERISKEEKT